MDGVIGLAPDDPSNGPNFLASLYGKKLIDANMFGLMLTTIDSQQASAITVGGYDKTQFKDLTKKEISWYQSTSSTMWQIPVNDMKIGEESIFVGDSRKKAVLNSFYQYITLPAEEFQIFKDNV